MIGSSQSDDSNGSDDRRLITDRSQLTVPRRINHLTGEACKLTNKLAGWLVDELKHWEGTNNNRSTRRGATTWLRNTATFEELARTLMELDTVVWFLDRTIEETKADLLLRCEVSAFFKRQPSRVGSEFWKENRRHEHFNEKVLNKVLEILLQMQVLQDARC